MLRLSLDEKILILDEDTENELVCNVHILHESEYSVVFDIQDEEIINKVQYSNFKERPEEIALGNETYQVSSVLLTNRPEEAKNLRFTIKPKE